MLQFGVCNGVLSLLSMRPLIYSLDAGIKPSTTSIAKESDVKNSAKDTYPATLYQLASTPQANIS
jgi:hypothetical protein